MTEKMAHNREKMGATLKVLKFILVLYSQPLRTTTVSKEDIFYTISFVDSYRILSKFESFRSCIEAYLGINRKYPPKRGKKIDLETVVLRVRRICRSYIISNLP